MPTYEYSCSCGLLFDGHAKLGDRNPKDCPACGGKAPSVVPSQVQGHFNKSVTGPMPQNTGIQGLDAHIDRTIGQSAKQGWDVAERRVKDKKQVIAANPGATGHDLSKQPDGSYRVLSSDERGVHERSQAIHGAAMDVAQQDWKASRGSRRPR